MTCGTGTGTVGPLPGDPSSDSLLSATWFFGGIQVSWTYPGTNPNAVAHTLLYRSTTNDFSTAPLHRIVSGNSYFDQTTVSAATLYYYWIEIVSVSGTVNDEIGPASATAIPRIEDYLTLLTNQINSGVLATALNSEILRIQEIADDLDLEAVNRVSADDALMLLVSTTQTDQDALLALIVAESSARTDADSALATTVSGALVSFGDDLAAVEVTLQANIDLVDGEVTNIGALYTVQVNVNGLVGGFGIYNDSSTIEAGFDVDTFWIGDGVDNVKPFIVTGGIVYMQNIVVQNALIENLSSEKILAGDIEVILGLGNDAGIYGGKTSFADATHAGFWLGLDGAVAKFIFGNADNSESISWNGTTLTVNGDIISTSNLQANAVTTTTVIEEPGPTALSTTQYDETVVAAVTVTTTGAPMTVYVSGVLSNEDLSDSGWFRFRVYRDATMVFQTPSHRVWDYDLGVGIFGTAPVFVAFEDQPAAGTYDYELRMYRMDTLGATVNCYDAFMQITEFKR